MRWKSYKTVVLQLLLFLSYNLLLFYFGYEQLLFIAILIHTFLLLLFAFLHFRKQETAKAFGFLIPFFVVLLIGLGSCGGLFSNMAIGLSERTKMKLDSMHQKQKENRGDTARKMGHSPNSHKGQKQSGIPRRRYKWLKKGSQ